MGGEANVWNPRTLVEVSGDTRSAEQRFIATANQAFFILTEYTYVLGTGALSVFSNLRGRLKGGVDFVEQSPSAFSLTVPATAGEVFIAVGMIGITGAVPPSEINYVFPVATVAALRAGNYSGKLIIEITAERGGARYYLDPTDTVSIDDDFLVIVDAGLNRWKLVHNGTIDVRWAGAVGDGVTYDTAAIQKALSGAVVGQFVEFSDSGNFYKCGAITVPTGVNLLASGRALYLATVTFSAPVSQVFNSTLSTMWCKQCKFVVESSSPNNVNNITFDRCYLDGTNLSHAGVFTGTCIDIGELAFDVHLIKTYISNYSEDGLRIRGDDGVSTSYIATGVFTTLTDSKIFNCARGVAILGSGKDGTSLHLSNVLLDHCSDVGLYTLNRNPRYTGQGEVNVYGSNVRIELCGKAIENTASHIYIDGLWSFGNATPSSTSIVNHSGRMKLSGRIANNAASGVAVNAIDGDVTLDGILGPGSFLGNVRVPMFASNEVVNHDLAFTRFRITKSATPGAIGITRFTVSDESFGQGIISGAASGDIAVGANVTVGSGDSAITYGFSGLNRMDITFPYKVGAVYGAMLTVQSTGSAVIVNATRLSTNQVRITMSNQSAADVNMSALTTGQVIEFALLMTRENVA